MKEGEPQWHPVPEDEWLLNIMQMIDHYQGQIDGAERQQQQYINLLNRYQNAKALGLKVTTVSDGESLAVSVAPKGEMGFNK